jgi:alkyl hydroperoxide reductase subunit AhpC
MTELREFARRSEELDKLGIPISVDDQHDAHEAWQKVAEKKFTILSDPGAQVIRRYGLLHRHAESDIALRTTLLIGPDGREKWRRVSQSRAGPGCPEGEERHGPRRNAADTQGNRSG